MKHIVYQLLLGSLLSLISLTNLWAQPVSLTLSNRDDSGTEIFAGIIFYSGNQFGDVPIWARFGGTGTKSFQIVSPGENKTLTITQNGLFFIRPTASMTIDKTKVLNFSGSTANIFGSIGVTVKQLAITTVGVNLSETTAGSELQFSYNVGVGIFPTELAANRCKVQLLSSSGVYIRDMNNSVDYDNGTTERPGFSNGANRIIRATVPSDVPPGTYRARVVTNGLTTQVLGSASPTFVVKSNQSTIKTTSVTILNNASQYCPGRDQFVVNFSVTGSPPAGTQYTVLISNQAGVFSNPNSSTLSDGNILGTSSTISPITTVLQRPIDTYPKGSYRIKVVSNNSSVQDDGNSIPVTLYRPDLPSVKTQAFCQNDPISSFEVGASNLMWFGITSNGVRTGWDSKTTPNIPTAVGSHSYEVAQIDNAGCMSSVATFTLTVVGKSNTPGVSNVNLCKGSPLQPLSANGQNLLWYNASGTQLPGPPSPSTDAVGTQVYKVSQQEGNSCRSDQATITVTIGEPPSAPTAITPAPICQYVANPPALAATPSANGSLRWYTQATGNAGQTDQAPRPSSTSAGSQTYYVAQVIGGCESTQRATVTQVVNAAPSRPSAPDASDLLRCQDESARPLSATAASGFTLRWYTSDAGQSVPNPSNGTATGPTPTTAIGVQTFYVTQTDGNGCQSLQQPVSVTIVTSPGAPSVTAQQNACRGTTPQALTASTQNGAVLIWSGGPISGTTTTAPLPQRTTAGTEVYLVRQRIGSCVSTGVSSISFTVRELPAAPTAIAPPAICQYVSNPPAVTATASANGTLRWYSQATGNTGQSDQAPIPTSTSAGNQSFYVGQIVGGCESIDRATITQVVNAAPGRPSAPAASDLLRCQDESARPLSATAATGFTLRWYTTDAGQSLPNPATGTTTAPTPTTAIGSQTFYITQIDGNGCQSLQQPISVTVVSTPGAPSVTAQQLVCKDTQVQSLTANAQNGAVLIWSGGPISGTTTTAPQPQRTTPGTEVYSVRQKVGSCVSTGVSSITFTVRAIPTSPTALSVQTACINTTFSLSANVTTAGNTLKWYASKADADGRSNSKSQASIQTGSSSSQTWYVTQADGSGCESTPIPVLARVLSQATARMVGDGNMYSTDSSAIRIYLGGEGPWTLTFQDGAKSRTFDRRMDNPLIVWVSLPKPVDIKTKDPQTYSITALSNDCGAGVLPAPYTLTINPVTAIDPGTGDATVSAYPNPMSGSIRIDWSATPRKAVTLRILTSAGRVVWQTDQTGTGNTQSEYVNTSSWAGGLYVFQLQSDGASMVERRIVKQ
ncbi:hypothetical protein GCM10027592_45580 [Spirosoma flavus]